MNSKEEAIGRKLRQLEEVAWLGINIQDRRRARRGLIRVTKKFPEIAEYIEVQTPTPEEVKVGPSGYLANDLGVATSA